MKLENNNPYSEQYRLKALQWVDQDGAARMLEDTKSAVLSEMIQQQGDIPHNKAERQARASKDWAEFVCNMVDARTKANRLKVERDYLHMRYMEQQSADANRRAEMKL